MKRLIPLLFLILSTAVLFAQNKPTPADSHAANQIVVKTDSSPNWNKNQNEGVNTSEGISYYPNPEGITLVLQNGSNSVKLFALTGQLLWSGDLNAGRFIIVARPGIYFLRVNNKSYKVICK